MQQPLQGPIFGLGSPAPPPPYSVQPVQLPTPTPPPQSVNINAFSQGVQQSSYPQTYSQPPQYIQPPGQISQPQFTQPVQGIPMQQQIPMVQQPLHGVPIQQQIPLAQQPYQGMQNVTPQQVQQVQQVQNVLQSLPPEKLQLVQQQVQQAQQLQPIMPSPQMMNSQPQAMMVAPQPAIQTPQHTTSAPSGLFGGKQSSGHGSGPQDAQQSDKVKRFLGDTLFGRVARSSVQTVTTVAKMPTALSPWGDNDMVLLPNVRYRDAVLFTTFAVVGAPLVDGVADGVTSVFGADSFISEIVSSGAGAIVASTVLKYSVFQIVEQAIDKGIIEHMLPEEEKMLQTTNVKSLQVGIKHKLMGVDADLRFIGVYPATVPKSCAKGWFAPYLFASARTPSIPRAQDFAICQSFGPFLGGDYLLAHKLISESAHTLSMCEGNPEVDIGTNRMLILFTGISPYRANMWSTSRRPGCGTIIFHLLDGCPAFIVPVTESAPVTAWSPWTLAQMRQAQYASAPPQPGNGMYQPEWQHEQICEWLDTIISVPHINPNIRDRYVDVLSRSVSLVINGALALEKCKPLLGKLDPDRAGICMFRY